MIALAALNQASKQEFGAALANIYEHAPWVADAAVAKRPFDTVTALHAALREAVEGGPEAQRLALVRGHPELGDKTKRAADLTAESAEEQLSAGLDRLSDEEYDRFHALNRSYRARFGHPFIICVRRHGKDSILRQFERRLANAPQDELAIALDEIHRIAALRLHALVHGPGPLAVTGILSTHVLDTHAGQPARNMTLELRELIEPGGYKMLMRAVTDEDGRTAEPLIADRPLPIGRYELVFDAGAYFAARGLVLPEPAFLGLVAIAFSIAEPEGHYHVPLLLSPWSYSTYRGS